VRFRRVGIAADPALRIFISKTPKLRNSTLSPLASDSADVIEGFLHHVEHLLLDEAGFAADAYDQVTFCECHNFLSGRIHYH